jgi:tetratricopeptide (TPR) repeat protein
MNDEIKYNMAVKLMQKEQWTEAIELFVDILADNPGFEHGYAWYDLACCYEDAGDVTKAKSSYKCALEYDKANPIFLGGLASFLYLYGDPQESLSIYKEYFQVVGEDSERGTTVSPAIEELKRRIDG